MDAPKPVMHIEVERPSGGTGVIVVDFANQTIDKLVEALNGWDAAHLHGPDLMNRLGDANALSKRLRDEVAPVLAGEAMTAALELTRQGYTGSQMAHFLRISTQAFTKRFGTDKARRGLLLQNPAGARVQVLMDRSIEATAHDS